MAAEKCEFPLFVIVPVQGWTKMEMDAKYEERAGPWADMVVGVLPEWEISNPTDADSAGRDLGLEVGAFISSVKTKDEHVACLFAYAVRCYSVEQAMALPGFSHLFSFTGAYPVVKKE